MAWLWRYADVDCGPTSGRLELSEDILAVEKMLGTVVLKEYPCNRPIILRNINCAYCGRPFDAALPWTKEHVIARRFVPRGCFDNQWNLIVRACGKCNGDKANLEDDISVITMMPDSHGRYPVDDPRIQAEVARKASKCRSRLTGKAVLDSHEQLEINGSFGQAAITFNFLAPAQVEEIRLFTLAHYHFRGFFFLITYQAETRRGGFMQGGFYPIAAVRRADWGSPHLRWFMAIVKKWTFRVHAIGADGFFKLRIYRHPEGTKIWAWAIEWNQAMRVVGFAGDEAGVHALLKDMPDQPMHLIHETEREWIRFRAETALLDEEDDLFSTSVDVEAI